MIGDPDQASRIAEGKRANEEGVDDAENGGAGADAQADDENGESGEAEVAAHGAKGVAEILGEAIEEGDAAGVAVEFLGGLEAAEFDEGGAAGFFGRHAALEVFLDEEIDVSGELVVEFAIEVGLAKKRNKAIPGDAQRVHVLLDSSEGGLKKRAMTEERRPQLCASAANCFRPLLVML